MQSFVYSAKNKENINTISTALLFCSRMKDQHSAIFTKNRDDSFWTPFKIPQAVNASFLKANNQFPVSE